MSKLIFFLLSLMLAIIILTHPFLHDRILLLGTTGYIGAFFTGFFFVISFTVLPSSAVLFILADKLNPYLLAATAGLGAVAGDYIIYRFFRIETDEVAERAINHSKIIRGLLNFKLVRWLSVLLGALIIASPFPDELGIALLGITKLETKKFLALSLLLNTVGILLVVGLGKII